MEQTRHYPLRAMDAVAFILESNGFTLYNYDANHPLILRIHPVTIIAGVTLLENIMQLFDTVCQFIRINDDYHIILFIPETGDPPQPVEFDNRTLVINAVELTDDTDINETMLSRLRLFPQFFSFFFSDDTICVWFNPSDNDDVNRRILSMIAPFVSSLDIVFYDRQIFDELNLTIQTLSFPKVVEITRELRYDPVITRDEEGDEIELDIDETFPTSEQGAKLIRLWSRRNAPNLRNYFGYNLSGVPTIALPDLPFSPTQIRPTSIHCKICGLLKKEK